jgi:hypothetical protein
MKWGSTNFVTLIGAVGMGVMQNVPAANETAAPNIDPGKRAWTRRSTARHETIEREYPRGGAWNRQQRLIAAYLPFGSTVVFDEPSGAACIPGGLCP